MVDDRAWFLKKALWRNVVACLPRVLSTVDAGAFHRDFSVGMSKATHFIQLCPSGHTNIVPPFHAYEFVGALPQTGQAKEAFSHDVKIIEVVKARAATIDFVR